MSKNLRHRPEDFEDGEVVGDVPPIPGGHGVRVTIQLTRDQARDLTTLGEWHGKNIVEMARELVLHALTEVERPAPAPARVD